MKLHHITICSSGSLQCSDQHMHMQGQGQARTPEGVPIEGASGTYTLEMTNSSGNLNRAEPHARISQAKPGTKITGQAGWTCNFGSRF